jgi:hypothetical protein
MPSVVHWASVVLGSHISQQAQINNGVDARMKAQTAKNHYAKKLEEEKKKVDEAEEAAKVVEEEFNVCISILKLLLFSHDHFIQYFIELDCQSCRILRTSTQSAQDRRGAAESRIRPEGA